jgi:predicted component of type VI protein secretion system
MRQLASRLMGITVPCTTPAWRAEVAEHLERVLNTCAGSSLSAPAYGFQGGVERVRHLLEQLPTSAATLERDILCALQAHDGRIVGWRSRRPMQWDKTGLGLYLVGDVHHVQPRLEVGFNVQLLPSGHAQVRPA